jgi:hypothetical protein
MMFSDKEISNFWSRVIKSDQCWLWTGRPHRDGPSGYGRIRARGKTMKAHRFAYILACGDIPDGILVRHTCDNPICVRPDHLVLGTDQDNMQDKVDRGRQAKGERNGRANLSDSDVLLIRSLYEIQGLRQALIARMMGINRRTVNRIVRHLSR